MLHKQLVFFLQPLRVRAWAYWYWYCVLLFQSDLFHFFLARQLVNLHFQRADKQLVIKLPFHLHILIFVFLKIDELLNKLSFLLLIWSPLLDVLVLPVLFLYESSHFIHNQEDVSSSKQAAHVHEDESHVILGIYFDPWSENEHGVWEDIDHKKVVPFYSVHASFIHWWEFKVEAEHVYWEGLDNNEARERVCDEGCCARTQEYAVGEEEGRENINWSAVYIEIFI